MFHLPKKFLRASLLAFCTATTPALATTSIEFYHSGIDHYFMTAYTDEATSLDNKPEWDWARTGKTFNVWLTQASAPSNASPVCRFYGVFSNGTVGSHFYTIDQDECAYVKSRLDWGWGYEGDAFYAVKPTGGTCPAGTFPIYRAYNNGMGGAPNHRYMTSQTEVNTMVAQGWSNEDIVMCSPSSSLSPPTSVAVTDVGSQSVGSSVFSSSTKLTVTWVAPTDYTVDHYAISASETVGNTSLSYSAASTATSATLTGLKAATSYSIAVYACKDATCTEAGSATAVTATTSEEYWQLQGSGNSYTTLSTTVAEGSVLSWVMRWGAEAGSAYAGRYQYYYNTTTSGREGVGVATTSGSGTNVSTLTSFSPLTTSGLRRSCSSAPGTSTSSCPATGAFEISATQAVPMQNGRIRIYFEASDVRDNNSARIYSLDSQDGLIGQDFHSGATQAYCGGIGSSDYAPGGACALELLIDVSSTPSASTPLSQARQFKIGYDWNTDWRWDGAAGTFMVITGDDNCNNYPNALFYATWDASNWTVAKDSSNCAKPIAPAAHGPVLVPLGGAAYKLYYEDQTNGAQSGKPLRLLYADGQSSGSSATVDFEDWESNTLARQVNFLWPDGSLLDAQDEAGLGDHMILTPNGSLDLQYMFVNRGGFDNTKWSQSSSGLGLAVLLNP